MRSKVQQLITQIFFWLTWLICIVITAVDIYLSSLNFILSISKTSEAMMAYLIIAFTELIRLLITGWLYFTFFVRPRYRDEILFSELWKYPLLTVQMMLFFIVVGAWRIVLLNYGAQISQIPIYNSVPRVPLLIMTIITGALSTAIVYKNTIARNDNTVSAIDSHSLQLQAQAMKKIEKKLTDEERERLALYLYQNKRLSVVSVQNVFRVIWASLVVGFIIALVEELSQMI